MQIDDETWAGIRSAYVDVSVPLAEIAARYGLTPQRIGARARKEGWPARTAKKATPKRPKAAASKKAAPRASGALPTRGAQRALIGRLYRAISLKLEHMEKRMASGEARSAQDEERESRALAFPGRLEAPHVLAARPLDLDHLRTRLGEHQGRQRTRQQGREIEDQKTSERLRHRVSQNSLSGS